MILLRLSISFAGDDRGHRDPGRATGSGKKTSLDYRREDMIQDQRIDDIAGRSGQPMPWDRSRFSPDEDLGVAGSFPEGAMSWPVSS